MVMFLSIVSYVLKYLPGLLVVYLWLAMSIVTHNLFKKVLIVMTGSEHSSFMPNLLGPAHSVGSVLACDRLPAIASAPEVC